MNCTRGLGIRSRFSAGISSALLLAAGVLGLSQMAQAEIITRDIYYTRWNLDNPAEANVKKMTVVYDRTAGTLVIQNKTNIANVGPLNADGIVIGPDGDLLVGGKESGLIHKVNPTTGTFTSQPTNVGGSFHIIVDPSKTKAWTSIQPGPLGEIPLTPFGPGIARAVTGATTAVTQVLPVPTGPGTYKWYYSNSINLGTPSGFGRIDMSTFQTTGILMNADGFHGMQFDPYSQKITISGDTKFYQVDPATDTIVATLDLAPYLPAPRLLDQHNIDGQGLACIADNYGRLILVDYATTRNISTPTRVLTAFVDTYLDDVAPLILPEDSCCPIGSGGYDGRNSQISQLPFASSPDTYDFRVADDFYLKPGEMHQIRSIEATLLTSVSPALLRKAGMELYYECDGKPGALVPLPPIDPANPSAGFEPVITITPTGQSVNGLDVVKVKATFSSLWLKGGNYWVSFFGKADGPLSWSWGTAGSGIIKGSPGLFKSVSNGFPNWVGIETICCGCTDFAFCVDAQSCKILIDNGTYTLQGSPSLSPLTPSGPTDARVVKTADDFVVPPCGSVDVCYMEAYIISNCQTAALDLYTNSCNQPDRLVTRLVPNRIIRTGRTVSLGGQTLEVLCLQFWNLQLNLRGGFDYWLSAYGTVQGNAIQRAYFAYNADCTRDCLIRFNPARAKGPSLNLLDWGNIPAAQGGPRDMAFLVAIRDPATTRPADTTALAACRADFDRSGVANIDDIFLFIAAWFNGCP